MASWPGAISAITLFTEDQAETKAWDGRVFGVSVHYEDDVSAGFRSGDTGSRLRWTMSTRCAPTSSGAA